MNCTLHYNPSHKTIQVRDELGKTIIHFVSQWDYGQVITQLLSTKINKPGLNEGYDHIRN